MTRSQVWVIAAAILAGSAIISVGLYAGLSASSDRGVAPREAQRAPAVPEAGRWTAQPTAPAQYAEPAPARAQPPVEPSPEELKRRAAHELLAKLYADRATYLERCGSGAAGQNQGGGQGSFRFDVVFDATGHEIARDIRPAGGASPGSKATGAAARDGILDCLRGVDDLPAIISPPGRSVEVSVTYPFP